MLVGQELQETPGVERNALLAQDLSAIDRFKLRMVAEKM
jgi:hypothetical protein